MVKLQDGSLVNAGELLTGAGQDEEGKSLKFKEAGNYMWIAESNIPTDNKTKRLYSFNLSDTMVKVSMALIDKAHEVASTTTTKAAEEEETETKPKPQEIKTEKAYKTSSPADYKKKYY